ncbi:hypothetical protein GJ744_003895 [Endocarpon pusillum]|uniref:Uncharacterized protein n=1 Tax=Endocarpon pusillum TaxID=364733 RepID=A0A8H7DZ55_9EURO|nr:hypothetical protein GJ744_003895 [Endocarpon pusillum]
MRKKDPCKAVNEINAWREAEMANKEKRKLEGSKVKKAGKGKGEREGEGKKGDEKEVVIISVSDGGADDSTNSSTDDLIKIKKGNADAARY